jgi:transposase
MAKRKVPDKKQSPDGPDLPVVHRNAAGIDIGSRFHAVAVAADRDERPVRTFNTFTGDLHRLADWLQAVGITTVAMESTSVYWIPVYEILEARGLEVLLVNARLVKNVPGRKTDINDAQWIQRLHQHGLLRGSFRLRDELGALKVYLRHRQRMSQYRASHIQHMQKALMQMNLQLHHVVSDITGGTGMRILHAILDGERNPAELAGLRDARCKEPFEVIEAALQGNYRPEHVFALRQAVELYEEYGKKIAACDVAIENTLATINAATEPPAEPQPAPRTRTKSVGEPAFDVRAALYMLLGVDLTQIHGIGPFLALQLIGECGDDMSRWPTVQHFTSWLTLAPGNKVSGGRLLSSQTRRTGNRPAYLFRLAAQSAGRTDTALGAFYRRLGARIGKAKAITATARKIAVLFYNALHHGLRYADPGASHYDENHRKRVVRALQRRASKLGYQLVETASAAPPTG